MSDQNKIPTLNVPGDTEGVTYRGDSWGGLDLQLREELTPGVWTDMNIAGAVFRLELYLKGALVGTLTNGVGGSGISIVNAAEGRFRLDPITRVPYPPGVLQGDLQITFSNNKRLTYCKVVWPIQEDATRNG